MYRILSATAVAAVLSACAATSPGPARPYDQAMLPAAVQVPAGHRVAMETVGVGQVTYACRMAAQGGGFEWAFVGPEARLLDRAGRQVGRYFGPPATWENMDGSRVTATQVAVAPAGAGNLPTQLVKANPAMGSGAMTGVTYIQRVATRGGAAPTAPCGAGQQGMRQVLQYQADYIFYKAS